MRTLKKTLCLVLAVVMLLGLAAINVSAADKDITEYSDYEKIEHKKAVSLLSGLGILDGFDTGDYKPEEELNRAQAAKIIAAALNMGEIKAGASQFTDMAGYEWAEPYIAFCELNNIVNGNGDGTFNPGGALTVSAFEKMLLCAVGYDPEYENMVGPSWEIGVAKLVRNTDLDHDIYGLNPNDTVTRDAAAQLAYNAVTGETQAVGSNNTDLRTRTYHEGVRVEGSGVLVSAEGGYGNSFGDYILGRYFNVQATKNLTDEFGRPKTTYKDSNKRLGWKNNEIDVLDDALITYNKKVNAATVANDLSGYKIRVNEDVTYNANGTINVGTYGSSEDDLKNINNTTLYDVGTRLYGSNEPATLGADSTRNSTLKTTNGKNGTHIQVVAATPSVTPINVDANKKTLADKIASETANGKIVEIYKNVNDEIKTIAEIVYTVGTVDRISKSGDVTTYTITGEGGTALSPRPFIDGSDDDESTLITNATLALDDIVTYAVSNEGNVYVYPTTTVTGKQTNWTTAGQGSVTVDGTVYATAKGVTDNSSTAGVPNGTAITPGNDDAGLASNNKTVTLYLDQFGYVVWGDGDSNTDYVYIIDASSSTVGSFSDTGYEVQYVDLNGTVGVMKVKNNPATYSVSFKDAGSQTINIVNRWVTVDDDSDFPGYYVLNIVDKDGYGTIGEIPTSAMTFRKSNSLISASAKSLNVTAAKAYAASSFGTLGTDPYTTPAATGAAVGLRANNDTKIIIRTRNNNNTGNVYRAYEGLSNMPTYENIAAANVAIYGVNTKDSDYASALYIDLTRTNGNTAETGDESTSAIWLLHNGYNFEYDDGGVHYYQYTAADQDGKADNKAVSTVGTLGTNYTVANSMGFVVPKYDANNRITGVTRVVPTTITSGQTYGTNGDNAWTRSASKFASFAIPDGSKIVVNGNSIAIDVDGTGDTYEINLAVKSGAGVYQINSGNNWSEPGLKGLDGTVTTADGSSLRARLVAEGDTSDTLTVATGAFVGIMFDSTNSSDDLVAELWFYGDVTN